MYSSTAATLLIGTVGVQHIHGTGEVGVSGGGTVDPLGDLAGGGGEVAQTSFRS